MKPAASINDRGIGIAVAIKISPGKTAQPRHSGKGVNRQKRTIPVVSQDRGDAVVGAKHDVQIAIGFNVNRPRTGVGGIGYGLRQFGLSRHVTERTRTVLRQQPDSAVAGKYQIRLEVVVEVERQNPFGLRRHDGRAAGKREFRTTRQTHFTTTCLGDGGCARTAQGNRSDPIPLSAA